MHCKIQLDIKFTIYPTPDIRTTRLSNVRSQIVLLYLIYRLLNTRKFISSPPSPSLPIYLWKFYGYWYYWACNSVVKNNSFVFNFMDRLIIGLWDSCYDITEAHSQLQNLLSERNSSEIPRKSTLWSYGLLHFVDFIWMTPFHLN